MKWMTPCHEQRADKTQREKGNILKRHSTKNIILEMNKGIESESSNNLVQQDRTNRWQREDALG